MLPYQIRKCERGEIKGFIEKWHYSHSINGVWDKYCFKLLSNGELIGAAIFGGLAMAENWKKFAGSEEDVIELRRLCCIDETMKNTESFFISRCLRWLNQHTEIKTVISYSDPNHNHSGIIYKASNFKYLGLSPKGRMIKFNGKYYHDKSVRTKYKGKLKPFAAELKIALEEGSAVYVSCLGKHCYQYNLSPLRATKQTTL